MRKTQLFHHQGHRRITVDPEILVGKPVIKGTRISVELILKLLAHGIGIEEILEEYPRLTRADILAALDYAHHTIKAEEIHLFPHVA